MPQCTLINAIASFKKSLARLKAYSSAASLERRQPCRCCSGTTNNVSSTSLVNLMNASVHAHQCNCIIQEVACKAQGPFIRGKSCKTSNVQVLFRHHNKVSSTSLVNLMNASVHAHQCNCVIQKVACKAQDLFIRGKS